MRESTAWRALITDLLPGDEVAAALQWNSEGEGVKARLGDLLVQQGVISEAQLASALEHQRRHPGYRKLGETLLELRLVTEEQMLRTLSHALQIRAIDLRKVTQIDPIALQTLDVETAERELVLPLRFVQQGASRRLQVAMADPTNLQAVDELQFRLGGAVEPCLSTVSQLRDAIRRFYRGSTEEMEGLIDLDPLDTENTLGADDEQEMKTWVGRDPDQGEAPPPRQIRVVELKFFDGPLKGEAVQIPDGETLVFGRGQDVNVTVEDNRMSRRHFEVSARGDVVELTDLASSNGTFVNQERVGRVTLRDGDWLQAGSTLIRVGFVEVA